MYPYGRENVEVDSACFFRFDVGYNFGGNRLDNWAYLRWVFSVIFSTISNQVTATFSFSPTFGGVLVVLTPIFAAVGGFIGGFIQGLIIAVLYNFLAPRIGGIKVRIE